MMRLDHNRAIAQLANKLERPVTDVKRMTIWGNHSADPCTPTWSTPWSTAARAWGQVDDEAWIADEFIPTVGKRGAAIIEARGASSAASAANAAIDHVHDWVLGTPDGDWVSMARPLRRLLRRRGGPDLRRSLRVLGRRVEARRGPRDHRLLARADRRDRRRAQGRARLRAAARVDLGMEKERRTRRRLAGSLAAAVALFALSGTAALAAEGDLDPSFSGDGRLVFSGTVGHAEGVAVDPEGRIVEAGAIDPAGSDPSDMAVARFLPDGSPDPSFSGDGVATLNAAGGTGGDSANGVAIDSQGRIVLAGETVVRRSERRSRQVHRFGRAGSWFRWWRRPLHPGSGQQ